MRTNLEVFDAGQNLSLAKRVLLTSLVAAQATERHARCLLDQADSLPKSREVAVGIHARAMLRVYRLRMALANLGGAS